MRTLAVLNQKGGSGKTTTAVNLAAALALAKRRVLVIDLDPQASATDWLCGPPDAPDISQAFLAKASIESLAVQSAVPNVWLVPASPWLMGLERQLAGEVGAETLLRRALAKLPQDRFDVALLDCPPSLGLLAVAALVAADGVLVPVEASVLALAGVVTLLETVERVRERLNDRLHVDALVPCRVRHTNLSSDVIEQLRKRYPELVTRTVIRDSVRLTEAPAAREPISVYAPDSSGDEDYRELARELPRRWKR